MKKCTIRVDSYTANSIIREAGNLTATCTAYVEAYYYVRQNGLKEIREMFSLPELRLMLDAENGVSFCPAMISGFPGHIIDSMALDRLDQKWGVDRNELMSKLNAMSPTLMVVLEQWLNSYWYGKMTVRPPYDEYLKGGIMFRIYQTHVHSGEKTGWAAYVSNAKEFAIELMGSFADHDHYLILDGCLYRADRVEFDSNGNYSIYRPDDPVIDPNHPCESYTIGDYRYTMETVE